MANPDIETRLTYLGFQRIMPSLILRPYIGQYWLMYREKSLLGYHEEFMHPLGGFGIIFNFGDAVWLNNQLIETPVFLDGANSQSKRMGFVGQVALLGIRFREGTAYPFLGIPLTEVNNQTAIMDILGEAMFMPMYEALAKQSSIQLKINLIESWLLSRLAMGKLPDVLVRESLKVIQKGVDSIDTLAQAMNISQRQLERLYQQQVGLSPKAYSRLLRIESARMSLKQPQQSLTDLGLQLGFYDQSHFIREFKAVIGMTPSAYVLHSQKHDQK